ncbi:hypothetical protein BH11PLA1_BH11PLA1_01790 [soil metagenome]
MLTLGAILTGLTLASSLFALVGATFFFLFWALHLVFFIIALILIVTSVRMEIGEKILWVLIVFFFPIIGLILFFIFARR